MKRRDEVLVGVFLMAAVAIGLLGTLWLVRGGLSSGYPLYAKFAWGQNLKPGQPVLLAGAAAYPPFRCCLCRTQPYSRNTPHAD